MRYSGYQILNTHSSGVRSRIIYLQNRKLAVFPVKLSPKRHPAKLGPSFQGTAIVFPSEFFTVRIDFADIPHPTLLTAYHESNMKFNSLITLVAVMFSAQRTAAVSWEQWDAINCDGDASMNSGVENEGFHCIAQQGQSVIFSFGAGDPCTATKFGTTGVILYTDEVCSEQLTVAGPGCWNFSAPTGGSFGVTC
ncbi:hypothetical protein BDP27DRAFT_1317865 [Rhodocollybia butyracea]|uniref:Uncharacterized protein n=1 Tax=Rhodocollybia butyracea TaxID=206335 RepID=A0A9P5Q3B5_9AGAR|nr:hypothetical protein BDP27DRAFT_1317865 [Rhodocollybia butyracea]